jgi:AraC-like DNA-binding protein
MKRLIPFFLSLLLLCGCAGAEEPAQVAATTLPVYEFTTRLCEGTPLTTIRLVTEEVSCLHDYTLNVRQVKSAEAAELKKTFENISRLYSSSLPQNQLQAELEILKLLQYFLRHPVEEDEPVELLRKQLEQDTQWQYSITEHCSRLGGNRDLLRHKFVERYQISPGDFRRQMRLRRILHLIVYSNLALKEIAFECGMKNLSHLSSFIRKECGKTASDLRREYRRRVE